MIGRPVHSLTPAISCMLPVKEAMGAVFCLLAQNTGRGVEHESLRTGEDEGKRRKETDRQAEE